MAWYNFAKTIFALTKREVKLEPVTSDEYNAPAKRPRNSVFDLEKFNSHTGSEMRHWEEGLKE